MTGKENYALCRTPPPQVFHSKSYPVNRPNWIHFNSPSVPICNNAASSYSERQGEPLASNVHSRTEPSIDESTAPCPSEMYWQ